jgi:hypothetical protein
LKAENLSRWQVAFVKGKKEGPGKSGPCISQTELNNLILMKKLVDDSKV